MRKLIPGLNDLATLHPKVAAEADGWDPKTVTSGSNKKMTWKCKKGHSWKVKINDRISYNTWCPYCANRKIWTGFNDLETLFPNIAAEADGWDPKKIGAGSHTKMPWKCNKGHTWQTMIKHRTESKSNCPFCSNQKVSLGFNDLETLFPNIAAEADGWDPKTVTSGSNKVKKWKCNKGHTWQTTPYERTGRDKTGCPVCAEYGFNPGKQSWFYLLERKGEQQIGITNNFTQRLRAHRSLGWIEIDKSGPHSGKEILKLEKEIKKWLRDNIGLISGTHENWETSKLKINSLKELKEKSGIQTSFF